jgi:hypothetical protein
VKAAYHIRLVFASTGRSLALIDTERPLLSGSDCWDIYGDLSYCVYRRKTASND